MATIEQVGLPQTPAPIWEELLPKVTHLGPFRGSYSVFYGRASSEPKATSSPEDLAAKTYGCLATTMEEWGFPNQLVSRAREDAGDWIRWPSFDLRNGGLNLAQPGSVFGMYLSSRFKIDATLKWVNVVDMVSLLNQICVPNLLVFTRDYCHLLRLVDVTAIGKGIFFAVDDPIINRPRKCTQEIIETLQYLGGQTTSDRFLSLVVTPKV